MSAAKLISIALALVAVLAAVVVLTSRSDDSDSALEAVSPASAKPLSAVSPAEETASEPPVAAESPADEAVLLLRIDGIKEPTGVVRVALYAGGKGYPEEAQASHLQSFPVADLSEAVAMDPVSPGRYAMAVYHDVDDNGKLNRALVGYPTEPYGFSNNARATFGPPAYDKAAFEAIAGQQTLEVQLK